jgi:hypothetical protein
MRTDRLKNLSPLYIYNDIVDMFGPLGIACALGYQYSIRDYAWVSRLT